jgi:MSHA biogenesis protein MshO
MPRQQGFTLVELVMVIVLLGIVATISTQFVSFSVRGAIDLGDRQQRALQGVVISEQITREVRAAFPLSVRAKKPGCLEWLPILGGTTYVTIPFEDSSNKVLILPFDDDVRQAIGRKEARLVVYGYGSLQLLYDFENAGSGPVSPVISSILDVPESTQDKVILEAPHRFNQRSPQKRIYAIGKPVSICQNQNVASKKLYRFGNYNSDTTQPSFSDLSSTESGVMSANLSPNSFRLKIEPASLQRSSVVDFAFELTTPNSEETTRVSQEVQIRNVP